MCSATSVLSFDSESWPCSCAELHVWPADGDGTFPAHWDSGASVLLLAVFIYGARDVLWLMGKRRPSRSRQLCYHHEHTWISPTWRPPVPFKHFVQCREASVSDYLLWPGSRIEIARVRVAMLLFVSAVCQHFQIVL